MEQVSGVYAITHPHSGRSYIGSSKDVLYRWAYHQKQLNAGTHHSIKLQRAWSKYGSSAFHFNIIEHCSALQRTVREQFWIDQAQASVNGYGFNMSLSAYGPTHPDISAKIAASNTGKKRGPLSEEHKAKISAAKIGMKRSEEFKAKMADVRKGLKHSAESRAKMSASHTGIKRTVEHLAKIRAFWNSRTVEQRAEFGQRAIKGKLAKKEAL